MPTPAIVFSNRFLRAVAVSVGGLNAAAEFIGIPRSTFYDHAFGRAQRFSDVTRDRLGAYFERLPYSAQSGLLASAGVIAHPNETREIGKMRWAFGHQQSFNAKHRGAEDAFREGLVEPEGFAAEGISP